jgi:hypothetical protein
MRTSGHRPKIVHVEWWWVGLGDIKDGVETEDGVGRIEKHDGQGGKRTKVVIMGEAGRDIWE